MKKLVALLTAMVLLVTLAACDKKGDGSGKKSGGYRIGFTDNYNGNSYHQTIEAEMQKVANELKAQGRISELTIVCANQDAAMQISQIEDFITQEYDLIILDPCSTSSLNSAVEEACDAGIPVVVINDGPIDFEHKLLYQLNFEMEDLAQKLTEYVCEKIGGTGNIIELRGTAGTTCDTQMHQGVLNALKKYSNVKIVSEIYTDWTGSKAQTELNSVLPTLGKVDGLTTQGGDAYAAVQAFLSAGYKEIPVIAGDNRGNFLSWWATDAPDGYDTLSGACNPWDGAMAMYIAVDILSGAKVVNNMNCPFGYVYADSVATHAGMAANDVLFIKLTWDEIKAIERGE